jgi:hypothetical protein
MLRTAGKLGILIHLMWIYNAFQLGTIASVRLLLLLLLLFTLVAALGPR